MALQVVTLEAMQDHSSLAEIQALTGPDLERLEAEALDILEAEVGRRLTVDAEDSTQVLRGDGLAVQALPERLDSITLVETISWGDITDSVETGAGGWLLRGAYPRRIIFRGPITVTGCWGLPTPERIERVLMDVIEALAVRKGDTITRRNELAPWGSVSDGGLRADRDSVHRALTLENLLRYDVRARLRGLYRPDIVAAV